MRRFLKMDDELKNFIAKNQKRKSVFDDFRDEIFIMVDSEVSQKNIVKYIKTKLKKSTKGLTQPNLSEWLKRQKKKEKNINTGSISKGGNDFDRGENMDDPFLKLDKINN